jgi:hypothetical protein
VDPQLARLKFIKLQVRQDGLFVTVKTLWDSQLRTSSTLFPFILQHLDQHQANSHSEKSFRQFQANDYCLRPSAIKDRWGKMKLSFRVCFRTCTSSMMLTLPSFQDLKQQKFTIDAEPSETVRPRVNSHFRNPIIDTCAGVDSPSEGEDCRRERMGGFSTEAYLFRLASISSASIYSCGLPSTGANAFTLSRQNPRRCEYC